QGYNRLADGRRAEGGRVRLAFCWAHARRKLIEARPSAGSPFVDEALRRIAEFYAIEKEIRGQAPEARHAVRQERSKPLLEAMHPWLVQQAARLSKKSDLGMAAAYVLDHWPGLILFADDGRIEMDSNLIENRIRPLTSAESLYPSSSSVWKH
ncbi:IS66 family transposase, partial [Cereibacter changlensis]|uniref:IS66 family transposase n=1 Tax=Cereibacter changlensis TaxID=402884 RepID=UPI003D15699E